MKYLTSVVLMASFAISSYAQDQLIVKGRIEYEKKINVYPLIENTVGKNPTGDVLERVESFKKKCPAVIKQRSVLDFDNGLTKFTPDENDEISALLLQPLPMVPQINVVYSDLDKNIMVIKKSIYEETYLIKTSLKNIKWKLTDETRDIAGYSCKRANGVINDSLYVVAFFTEKIAVSSGPEIFHGLPGMILGLAIPHDHVNWFAVKIDPLSSEKISPPTTGKQTTTLDFEKRVDNLLKTWGGLGYHQRAWLLL